MNVANHNRGQLIWLSSQRNRDNYAADQLARFGFRDHSIETVGGMYVRVIKDTFRNSIYEERAQENTGN